MRMCRLHANQKYLSSSEILVLREISQKKAASLEKLRIDSNENLELLFQATRGHNVRDSKLTLKKMRESIRYSPFGITNFDIG